MTPAAAGAGSSGQADDAPRSDDPPEEELPLRRDEEPGTSPRNDLAASAGVTAPVLCAWPGQLTSIVWFRRDLRLDDNPALNAALKTGGNVVSGRTGAARAWGGSVPRWRGCERGQWARTAEPEAVLPPPRQVCVYIWAPEDEGVFYPGRCSRWWLHQSLKSLSASFRKLGSRLILRQAQNVSPLAASVAIRGVFAEQRASRGVLGPSRSPTTTLAGAIRARLFYFSEPLWAGAARRRLQAASGWSPRQPDCQVP